MLSVTKMLTYVMHNLQCYKSNKGKLIHTDYALTVSLPLYTALTFSSFLPPITNTSVADKAAHVVHAQGSGRSLKYTQELVVVEYM